MSPVVGFICPVTREQVEFDHFDKCEHRNERAAYSPYLAAGIAADVLTDVRHAAWGMTATTMMGCIKAKVFQHLIAYHLDPTKRTAMQRGTEQHHRAAARLAATGNWLVEGADISLTVSGRLFPGVFAPIEGSDVVTPAGILVTTAIDAIKRDGSEHLNHKFPSDFSVKWRKGKMAASGDHTAQLNIERLLVTQQPWAREIGYGDTTKLTIWDHATGLDEGPAPLAAPHRDEAWILARKPGVAAPDEPGHSPDIYARALSIRDILELWLAVTEAMRGVKTQAQREELVASVTCNGDVMFGGRGCLQYCEASAAIKELDRRVALRKAGGA